MAAPRNISEYVPVRSVWALQLYASEAYSCGAITDSGVEDPEAEIPFLVARLLCAAIEQRLQRELSISFTRTHRDVSRIRGKINVFDTERHQLLEKGKANCSFNDFTIDSPVNRYLLRGLDRCVMLVRGLKSTEGMRKRLSSVQLDEADSLATRARRLVRTLRNGGVQLDTTVVEPRNRLLRQDIRPVALATLMLRLHLPDRGDGATALRRSKLSETELRKLFEDALLGIFRFHLTERGWRVMGPKEMSWPVQSYADSCLPRLPKMRTDITMVSPEGRTVIVDAKFTQMATRGDGKYSGKLKSGHLYQLHSYVTVCQTAATTLNTVLQTEKHSAPVAGVLVYADLGYNDESEFPREQRWVMNGHPMGCVALDLRRSVSEIREAALQAVTVIR